MEFKVERVKTFKIFIACITGKISINDIKLCYKFYTLFNKNQNKTLKVKDLFVIRRGDLRRAAEIYNLYTVGTKINAELSITAFDEIFKRYSALKLTYPQLATVITNSYRAHSAINLPKHIADRLLDK